MNKKLSLIIGAAILAACISGCTNDDAKSSNTDASVSVTDNSSVTAGITVDYSKNFNIEYLDDNIKKVTDGEGRELVLIPKSLGEIPEEYADSTVITTPVENAVFLSSTQICMLRAADNDEIWDSVGAVSSDASGFIGLDKVAEKLDSGDILNVGGMSGDVDYEQLQMLNPDVVFVYTGDYGQQNIIEKLEELDIDYAVDNEFLETDYLARMEWMKFILTFYNEEDSADKYMMQTEQKLADIKTKLEGTDDKKVAMFTMYDGSGYGTGDSTWTGSLLTDVGGTNAFSGMTDYSCTAEVLFDCVQDADIIIYTATPTMCNGMAAIEEAFPQITECEAYKNNCIYQQSDSYWTSIDQTDILAEDLASIINPEIFEERELTYFTKVEK